MSKKILLIDDEKNIRLTVSECLKISGYEVDSAVSGEHGLEKYSSDFYQLVLLDMKMPGLDGLEVLRRIKSKNPYQSVIMITAHGTIETAVEAMKLGAVDYLRKPFTPDEIRSIVNRVFNRETLDEKEAALSYENSLEYAKNCINMLDFEKAYEYLRKTIGMEPRKPEPYNLLGVYLEIKNELIDALKMYRVALDIDPTYKPAQANLDRGTKFQYTREGIDMGDKQNNESDEDQANVLVNELFGKNTRK